MDWSNPAFILLIIAVSYGGWLINNWIRAKHGYPLEDEYGGKSVLPASASDPALSAENDRLREELKTVLGRVAVLERIVTDRGYSLAEEIEALRERPGTTPQAQIAAPHNSAKERA